MEETRMPDPVPEKEIPPGLEDETPAAGAKLRSATFRHATGNVTEKIDPGEGLKPFDITYEVPSPGAVRACRAACMRAEDGGGIEAMSRFIVDHLKEWPFDEDISEEGLAALEQDEVFYALFNEIAGAGDKAKNS